MPGESATQRIAAKLAAKGNASAKADEVEDEEEDEDEDGLEDIEDEGEDEERPSIAERAAARRRRTATPTKAKGKGADAGKRQPTEKQLAARKAFAERSKAAAAERKAAQAADEADETEEVEERKPTKATQSKPVQTEAEVRAAQTAKRKAEQAARSNDKKPRSTPTSKATKVEAKAEKPATKRTTKTKTTTKAKAPRSEGETKTKVLALVEKGYTRAQIRDALGLSYPSIYYHTRGVKVASGPRGGASRTAVETDLDEAGEKMPRGKKETVSRSEAMRRLWLSGIEVADVAREFEVRYQIAYTAIKPLMTDEEGDEE